MKHKMLGLMCVLIVFAFCTVAHAVSFNCHEATTSVEKTMRSDKGLSELDDLLMESYRKAPVISISQFNENKPSIPQNTTGTYKTDKGSELKVQHLSSTSIKFEFMAFLKTNVYRDERNHTIHSTASGGVSGEAPLANNIAVYSDPVCTITIEFLRRGAAVKQEGSCNMGNFSVSGMYRLIDNNPPKFKVQ